MSLPRGAFVLPGGSALKASPVTGGTPTGKVLLEFWQAFHDGEYLRSEWLITRAQARKLIRQLLKANEVAEASQHATRLVRRGSPRNSRRASSSDQK
jgi:hypothetical protein